MARKRRGRGEGAIYERADGLWEAKVSLGYDGNGKRIRKTVYGKTKAEVQEKLRKLQGEALSGLLAESNCQTSAELLNRWLEDVARPAIRPTSYLSYEGVIRLHISLHLGGIGLGNSPPSRCRGCTPRWRRPGPPPACGSWPTPSCVVR
jgi:integrase